MKKLTLLLALTLSLVAISSAFASYATYTLFDIPAGSPNAGSFTTDTYFLEGIADLAAGNSYTHYYAYRSFTPTVDGIYALGMSSASYDPVMILYSGLTTFPVSKPDDQAIAFNDDGNMTSFVTDNGTITFSESNSNPNFLPVIQNFTLQKGVNYLVAISSLYPDEAIPLPASFFVAGPDQVLVDGGSGGGANAVPEPSTYALLCISLGVVGYARKRMVKS